MKKIGEFPFGLKNVTNPKGIAWEGWTLRTYRPIATLAVEALLDEHLEAATIVNRSVLEGE
jgi:hypothetical protein